jgi:hypothetical protein
MSIEYSTSFYILKRECGGCCHQEVHLSVRPLACLSAPGVPSDGSSLKLGVRIGFGQKELGFQHAGDVGMSERLLCQHVKGVSIGSSRHDRSGRWALLLGALTLAGLSAAIGLFAGRYWVA